MYQSEINYHLHNDMFVIEILNKCIYLVTFIPYMKWIMTIIHIFNILSHNTIYNTTAIIMYTATIKTLITLTTSLTAITTIIGISTMITIHTFTGELTIRTINQLIY